MCSTNEHDLLFCSSMTETHRKPLKSTKGLSISCTLLSFTKFNILFSPYMPNWSNVNSACHYLSHKFSRLNTAEYNHDLKWQRTKREHKLGYQNIYQWYFGEQILAYTNTPSTGTTTLITLESLWSSLYMPKFQSPYSTTIYRYMYVSYFSIKNFNN
jgi:hypothetical protein